ncbi:MAG: hypothetical protein EBU90_21955 [Proteobacteria bacterium]|nr:hypothetical protein [Pseudomonadota bacterium]NBP16003.1 hypothetical protein [bacterium]
MERTVQLTKIVFKNGKKAILEETNYEFCEDIWRIIKSYLLYESDWYRLVIQPYRNRMLVSPEIGITNRALGYFWRTKISPNIHRIDYTKGDVETYRSLLRIFVRNRNNEQIRKLAVGFLVNQIYDAKDIADEIYRRFRYIEEWELEEVAKKTREDRLNYACETAVLEDEIFKTLKRLKN